MILANGIVYDSSAQNELLELLPERLTKTLCESRLDPETVISAFDRLGKMAAQGKLRDLLDAIDFAGKGAYFDLAVRMMQRPYLEYKRSVELGKTDPALFAESRITCARMPLGVLFHIAAGNMDALPVVSIAEGLLVGNINILKLPGADNGLTLRAVQLLIELEPQLRDYIYIFDTPSSDVVAMKKLADMADGIVVWGGDEAVSAVRNLAKPGTRLIEWGHKLGFAYISGYEDKESELLALAEHILRTKQLLCSSCQVIYLDTDSDDEVKAFASDFLNYLNRAAEASPVEEISAAAEASIKRRVRQYEDILGENTSEGAVFYGNNVSVTAACNSTLEVSCMFGNVYVKPLPRTDIIQTLRQKKEYLQTAGLICTPEKRTELSDVLVKAGVTRVMRAGTMSDTFDGEAHDGEFALLRYTRLVNAEK